MTDCAITLFGFFPMFLKYISSSILMAGEDACQGNRREWRPPVTEAFLEGVPTYHFLRFLRGLTKKDGIITVYFRIISYQTN